MTKSKVTKKALLASALSLILCFTMLLGTTYAWFTDSVSSMNNVITSGNLDIVLEYSLDGDNWAEVTEDTAIFDEDDLWEPGHTVAAALRIRNAGTLALKYALSTSVYYEQPGTNVYGKEFKLSDYLEVYACGPQENNIVGEILTSMVMNGREAALGNGTAMAKAAFNEDLAVTGNNPMLPGREDVVLVAITMPTTVGNEANYKTGTNAPYIRFGINLNATQAMSEDDSFGTDYDKDAEFALAPVADVAPLPVAEYPIQATLGMGGALTNVELESAFEFATTETYDEAQLSDYRYWHADFVVSADKDIADNAIVLAGYYEAYCKDHNNDNWVALVNDGMPVAAGEEVRLLEFLLNGGSMSYEELCNWVPKFKCGLGEFGGADLTGTTVTVELRLFEVLKNTAAVADETGNYVTVGTYTYTF